MGKGSSQEAAVTMWGWRSCCDSAAVVLSHAPGGRAAHEHPCEHSWHPLAGWRGNPMLLMCLGGEWGTPEALRPAALQVGERCGGSQGGG